MTDDLRLRTRMIGAGVGLSVLLLAAVSAWVAETWQRPHRGGLIATCGCAAVATVIIAVVPHERIVLSRWREPFFLSWSLSLIAFITIAAGLDAGVRSPVVLMLFLTLVYAALSYPRWMVALVSAVSLLAVLVLSQLGSTAAGPPTDPVYLIGLMLTLAVTGVMCVSQARIQQEARAELGRLSRSDPLTGALNRLGFAERMASELAVAGAGHSELALVVLDFDGFKAVNDELGHCAGDELLCWSSRAMRETLRPGDALGRLGGDEFAALLPGSGPDAGCRIADRLRLALSARIGACAGVASTTEDGFDNEQLHHCADVRLYAAKRGRPAVVLGSSVAG